MKRSEFRSLTRRGFVSAAASLGGSLLVSPLSAKIAPAQAPEPPSSPDQSLFTGPLRPFSLTEVRLLPGPFLDAQKINSAYLLSLPQDRLLHTFRVNAGLPSSAEPIGGWEKPDCELRGHFAGGHYLSALALSYAATGEPEFKKKAEVMVSELARCQRAHGNGYLSAFPEDFFDRLRNGVRVWAPYYTLHKILAGLLCVHEYCGNAQALEMAQALGNWVRNWTKGLSDAHMDRILLTEYGGMNEALVDLSVLSKKEEYLDLAHRFDQKALFDPLAARRDELTGLHTNTQIPKVIGAARRYEVTGEGRYRDVAEYFWREVTGERCYCTGGTSDGEQWQTAPGVLASQLSSSTSECCCAYNMLKLTRHIFAWTADPRAADYYERTLFNSRLGTQSPETGGLMYYYPLASGYWKYFGSPLHSFWCCTGTGVEEFAKFGDSVYFHDDESLSVNLFVASEVRWKPKGLRLRQQTPFPDEGKTTLTIEAERPVAASVKLRIPWWATRGGTATVNGEAVPAFASPSSYLVLRRTWNTGDRIELEMPMGLSAQPMPDDPGLVAVLNGPLVLAGRLGNKGLTREMTYGEEECELKGEPTPPGEVLGVPADPASWVEKIAGSQARFRSKGQRESIELVPLNRIFGERYAVYWRVRERQT
jgi:DUF1680 family protein